MGCAAGTNASCPISRSSLWRRMKTSSLGTGYRSRSTPTRSSTTRCLRSGSVGRRAGENSRCRQLPSCGSRGRSSPLYNCPTSSLKSYLARYPCPSATLGRCALPLVSCASTRLSVGTRLHCCQHCRLLSRLPPRPPIIADQDPLLLSDGPAGGEDKAGGIGPLVQKRSFEKAMEDDGQVR